MTPDQSTAPGGRPSPDQRSASSPAVPSALAQPSEAIPSGWYPDPVDENQQRYFDGTTWSGHVAPRPGRTPPPPPRRRYRGWVGAGLVAVIVVAAVSAVVLRGSEEAEPVDFPTITEAAEEPTGETEMISGGELTAGQSIEGRIDEGQHWQVNMTVPEDLLILLDARPTPAGGGDLTMFAYDEDGEQIAGNDDRGELSRIGGDDLDPVLVLGASPGSVEVEVVVGSWLDESSTDFVLHAIVPEQIETEFDETWQVETDSTEMRTLVVTQSDSYLFEVIADGGAHGFFIDTNTGEVITWRSGEEHIAQEQQVDPGTHLVIVSRDSQDAGEVQLRINPAVE